MRDTILGRLRAQECAWIDCDTKHEWISDMKITKSQLKQIIKEELDTAFEQSSSPHAGKSVEEIVSWHTDKWDKNIRDYSQMMPPELLGPLINPMMYQVVDSMREPGVKDEYYAHLSDEEYGRLESILNDELERRKI